MIIMPAGHPEAKRVPGTPSPKGLRFDEVRRTNYVDEKPHNAIVAHDDYAAAAAAGTEGAAAFGDRFKSLGYERVTFLAEFTKGAATAVHVLMQSTNVQREPESLELDTDWYDVYEDEAGDGTLVRHVIDLTIAADGRVAFVVPTVGRYMRIKVWMTGADAASRIAVKAIRHMDAQ